MAKIVDITGQRFGQLTVSHMEGRHENREVLWFCNCDCGGSCVARGVALRQGTVISCGCVLRERKLSTIKNLEGMRFGRWTVIKRAENGVDGCGLSVVLWLCECDCGTLREVAGANLKSGDSYSCGCYKSEMIKKSRTKHNSSGTKLYKVWCTFRKRCRNESDPDYHHYGGRGIKVCKEWLDFSVFSEWAYNNGYKEGLTIDRINNNGPYSPENCRWTTQKEQTRNTRRNRYITFKGKTQCLSAWAEELKISEYIIRDGLNKGLSLEEVLICNQLQL